MGVIIRNGIEYSGAGMGGGSCDCNEIVYLTQKEYDALSDDKLENNTEYWITDAGVRGSAENLSYDNSVSGLDAKNVQTAIDKMSENLVNENGETFKYGYQDGKRGVWVKEADTDVFVPFSKGLNIGEFSFSGVNNSWTSINNLEIGKTYIITIMLANVEASDINTFFTSGFEILQSVYVAYTGVWKIFSYVVKATETTATLKQGIYAAIIQLD